MLAANAIINGLTKSVPGFHPVKVLLRRGTAILIISSIFCFHRGHAEVFAPAVLWPEGEFHERNPFPLKVYEGVTLFERFQNVNVAKLRGPNKQRNPRDILLQALEEESNPIFAFGIAYADAMRSVASEYPDTQFVLVDSPEIEVDNVLSVSFANEEGGYLMGAFAAVFAKAPRIGFVGGMNNASIRNFACGYAQGAKAVNPDINVVAEMIGYTPDAFNHPTAAFDIAKAQYEDGVEVIFHAAGGSGAGVFDAAVELDKKAIGVDANQNGIQPGFVSTSLLKRIDVVAYSLLTEAYRDKLESGHRRVGVLDGALDWAIDQHNVGFISSDIKATMDNTMAMLASGSVKVHRTSDSNNCPFVALDFE